MICQQTIDKLGNQCKKLMDRYVNDIGMELKGVFIGSVVN